MNPQKKIYAGAMLAFCLAFSAKSLQAQTCIVPPTCEELGYKQTEADCQGKDIVMKCPTDMTKMTCLSSSTSNNIEVGAILYGDGTVSSEVIAGKKPIGVVVDPILRYAMGLYYINENGKEENEVYNMDYSEDYPVTCQSCDYRDIYNCKDGITATEILADCPSLKPIKAVKLYNPENCTADFCKQGNWFLPSILELLEISIYRTVIDKTMTLLGMKKFIRTATSSLVFSEVYLFGHRFSSTGAATVEGWELEYIDESWTIVRPFIKF